MTNCVLQWLILLAARQDMHRVWGRFDHGRPGFDASYLIIAVALVALVIVAAWSWRRDASRSTKGFSSNSASRLFRELCAAHGLKLASRRLLKRLAESRRLTNPATLFVEPQHFDTKNLPAELKSSANELRQIRNQLFD